MERSVTRIIFPKIIGIFIFILFLGFLNFLSKYLTFSAFLSLTNFLNRNALFLISISIVFLFAELLSNSKFPSNIFGPILNFFGAWMLLTFSFAILESLQIKFNFYFLKNISLFKSPIFFTVLSLTFVFGYLPIIYKIFKNKKESELTPNGPEIIEKIKIIEIPVKKDIRLYKKSKRGKKINVSRK
jgi:hypothetical protein